MAVFPRFASTLASTVAARARRGPLVASWSLPFEAAVAFLRETARAASGLPPEEQRRVWSELRAPPHPVMRRVRRSMDGAGGVRAEWFEPHGYDGGAVVLFLHGGAFVWGSMDTHCEMVTRIALASGARLLALDYRLAPESPFPAQIEDAVASYLWLVRQGVPPRRIVVAGDSAGGNLTIATMLALRDRGEPLPGGGLCICPWVDPGRAGGSIESNARWDWGFPSDVPLLAAAYAGTAPLTTPLLAPVHADLRGLPPLHVLWGSREMLRDQALDFVARAKDAGVEVHAEEYPDMVHVWMVLYGLTPEAERAYQSMGRFVRRLTR